MTVSDVPVIKMLKPVDDTALPPAAPLAEAATAARLVCDALPSALHKAGDANAAAEVLRDAVLTMGRLAPEDAYITRQLRDCFSEFSSAHEGSTINAAIQAELVFAFASFYGGRLPFDVTMRLWKTLAHPVVQDSTVPRMSKQLSSTERAKVFAFGLACRKLSSPAVLATLRLMPGAPAVDALLTDVQRDDAARFDLDVESVKPTLQALQATMAGIAEGGKLSEQLPIAGTPYVVDFVSADNSEVIVVPRSCHRAPGVRQLSGEARLLDATLSAAGWRVRWAWPEEVDVPQEPSDASNDTDTAGSE